MRITFLLAALIAATLPSGMAQTESATAAAELRRGTARLYITPAPGQIPTSLRELCSASSLIIEGVVQETLAPRETSPRSLETDAVISVVRTVKGPTGAARVLIAQRGGTLGDLNVKPVQYALVKPGEHYLLFLTEDKRPKTPEVPGIRRFLITGIWSGLFRMGYPLDDGAVFATAQVLATLGGATARLQEALHGVP